MRGWWLLREFCFCVLHGWLWSVTWHHCLVVFAGFCCFSRGFIVSACICMHCKALLEMGGALCVSICICLVAKSIPVLDGEVVRTMQFFVPRTCGCCCDIGLHNGAARFMQDRDSGAPHCIIAQPHTAGSEGELLGARHFFAPRSISNWTNGTDNPANDCGEH